MRWRDLGSLGILASGDMAARSSLKPDPWRRATRTVVVLGLLVLLAALTGVLSADRGISIDEQDAVRIAQRHIDFAPTSTVVRLVRRGIESRPFWAVSFSVPSEEGYAHLAVVLVDASDGEVVEVRSGP